MEDSPGNYRVAPNHQIARVPVNRVFPINFKIPVPIIIQMKPILNWN